MKSLYHTLTFLTNYTPKTALDGEFIDSFLVQRFGNASKTRKNGHKIDANALGIEMFHRWIESGLEAIFVAFWGNSVVLLGNVTLETAQILAKLTPNENGDWELYTHSFPSVPVEELTPADEPHTHLLHASLYANNLEPDLDKLQLRPKHIPNPGERVIFYDFQGNNAGVGIVRSISETGDVEFYCYFKYAQQYPEQAAEVGYSLHEKPGVNLYHYVIESIEKENSPCFLGNTTSAIRRFQRELEKVGKLWNHKLRRIEPIKVEVDKDQPYYYIDDKLKVVTDREKKTPVSHKRFLAGNYFIDRNAALEICCRYREMLECYMASSQWPKWPRGEEEAEG